MGPRAATHGGETLNDPDVVVVGGGLAGLAAAVTLTRARVSVRLLEARERVGGRVQTLRAPFTGGLYAEAGGEFVGGEHRVTRDFLRAYGLGLNPLPDSPRTFSLAGQVRRGGGLADFGGQAAEDGKRLERATAVLSTGVEDSGHPWASPAAREVDARSLGEWLDELGLDQTSRAHQDAWTTVDYGVEPTHLSLLQYARDERLLEDDADPAARARGGMDRLPVAMAADLGPAVCLGARVSGLRWDDHSVTARYTRNGARGVLRARYAVVALPLTVLRSLDVSPPFEGARREAIRGLRYSRVVKVLLQFRRRFWEDRGLGGGTLTDDPTHATYDATYGQPGPRGILTVYTAGWTAAELAELPEEQRIARCLDLLERTHSSCRAELEVGVSTVWDAERASLGAYSYFGPGELTRYGPEVARPEGRIHFAGEHTDRWQATMNGALASGVRAAEEVLGRLT